MAYTSPGPERTRMGRLSTQLIGGHAQLRMAVSPSSLRGRRRHCGRRRRAAGRDVLPACPRRAGIPGRRSLRERPRWRVHTGAGNVLRSPANQSIHAPAYLLKGLHEWLGKNCLEFLKPKLSSYWLNGSSRSLDSWLLRPQLEGKECAKVGITPQMHWETLVCYSRTMLFWMRPASSGRR